MTGKLLAREQKKGKETISSILCLVHEDFWGSHSRVFCNIGTLSIHVALIPQESEVLHKPFNSYCHPGYPEGGREQGQLWLVFLLVVTLLTETAGPLKKRVGESKPKEFLAV